MRISLLKHIKTKRRGFTLIEVILSLAILGIIIIPFLNMFVFSAVTNSESGDILDSTYVAQEIMENRYGQSKSGKNIPIADEYPKEYYDPFDGGYWIQEDIKVDGNLVGIVVKVYSDESKSELKAQMETSILWNMD